MYNWFETLAICSWQQLTFQNIRNPGKMAENALGIRRSAKSRFTRKKNEVLKAITRNEGSKIIKKKFEELTDAWSTVEGKHDIYMIYLSEEEIIANEKWIEELQEEYNIASAVYAKFENEH